MRKRKVMQTKMMLLSEIILLYIKFFEMREQCCSKKEKHFSWGHFVIIVVTNYRNSVAHMAASWYNAIYKLSNFVVAVVIRGVWSYDCGSGVYGTWLLGRLQSCSLSNAPFVFLYSSSTRSPEIRWRVAIVENDLHRAIQERKQTHSGIRLNTE